jgi:hypothetical protein
MGKTQSTGNLTNALAQDSSNNIGIGGSANASFKLQVTGATNLTGALSGTSATFSSTIDVASTSRFNSGGNWMQFETNVLTSLNNDGAHIRSVISTDANPTYTWKGDTNTGMFTPAADTIGFSTAGTERMRITSGGDLGIGTSTINYATANRRVVEINGTSTALLAFKTGDVAKSYLFQTGSDFIMTNLAAAGGNFVFENNGAERMRIRSNGNVGVGNIGADIVKLYTKSDTANSSSFALGCENGSVNLFLVRGDALIQAQGVYNFTTGAGANVWVDTDGSLRRSTSSLKYKKNVENYTKGLAEVLQMRPVTYNSKNEDETQTYAGLIAEEVHEAGLTEFVQYAADGSPDALSYSNMVSLLVKAIQEQQAQIEELSNKIVALESK